MNNKFVLAVVSLLIIANMVIGAMAVQANNTLNSAKSQLAGMSAPQSSISTLQAKLTQDQTNVTSLNNQVSQISTTQQSVIVDFTTVVRQVTPSVVRLDVTGPGLRGYGSGVIISPTGYVLTSEHVVHQATSIQVTLSTGDKFTATIANSNVTQDIAILKMNSSRTNFPAATLGSVTNLALGDEVLAAGFPLGSDPTTGLPGHVSFTAGIVSAFRLDSTDGVTYIQNTAAINPGGGGGGLFDANGKLVGIPNSGYADGIYTATPIDLATPLITTTVK